MRNKYNVSESAISCLLILVPIRHAIAYKPVVHTNNMQTQSEMLGRPSLKRVCLLLLNIGLRYDLARQYKLP